MLEVAGAIGNSVEPLPEGLWSKISNRLYEHSGEAVPPLAPLPASPTPREIGGDRRDLAIRRFRRMAIPAGIAAALVAVLAFQLVGADNRITNLQGALRAGDVRAALALPGHRLVDLNTGAHRELAQFVLLPDGRGYLVSSRLPTLAPSQTYQLWGIISGTAVSIGLMGRSPGRVTFTVSGSERPTELAVTAERSGGSLTPTLPIVASGAV
jgi:hypothetical protein